MVAFLCMCDCVWYETLSAKKYIVFCLWNFEGIINFSSFIKYTQGSVHIGVHIGLHTPTHKCTGRVHIQHDGIGSVPFMTLTLDCTIIYVHATHVHTLTHVYSIHTQWYVCICGVVLIENNSVGCIYRLDGLGQRYRYKQNCIQTNANTHRDTLIGSHGVKY